MQIKAGINIKTISKNRILKNRRNGFVVIDSLAALSVMILIVYMLSVSVYDLSDSTSDSIEKNNYVYVAERELNIMLEDIENGINTNPGVYILNTEEGYKAICRILCIDEKRDIYKAEVVIDDGYYRIEVEGYEKISA